MSKPIRVGDVVTDLAQGRPMQVVERAADTAEAWSEANDYDLLSNYANSRLGADAGDTVWTCVYVSDIRSEPTKTYDFPASRLARIETESAHGERVQDTLVTELLASLIEAGAGWADADTPQQVELLATDAGVDEQLVRDASEIAEARLLDSEDDDDDDDGEKPLIADGGQHISVVCRNDGRQMGERPDGGYRCPECGHVAGVDVEVETA